jgi:hypothetical protein
MTDFRDKMVTIVHAVSRSNSTKMADFNFAQTLPVWAAVQACWILGANDWDHADKATKVNKTQSANFTQSVIVCFSDDDMDNCGLPIDDDDADAFWQLVDQFGN